MDTLVADSLGVLRKQVRRAEIWGYSSEMLAALHEWVATSLAHTLTARRCSFGGKLSKSGIMRLVRKLLPDETVRATWERSFREAVDSTFQTRLFANKLLHRVTGDKRWRERGTGLAKLAAREARRMAGIKVEGAVAAVQARPRVSKALAATFTQAHFASLVLLIQEGVCGNREALVTASRLARAMPGKAVGGQRRFVVAVATALCAGHRVGSTRPCEELSMSIKCLIDLGERVAAVEGTAVTGPLVWGIVMQALFAFGLSPGSMGAAHPMARFLVGLLDAGWLRVSEHMPAGGSSCMREWAAAAARAVAALVVFRGEREGGFESTHLLNALRRLVFSCVGGACESRTDAARRLGCTFASDAEIAAVAAEGGDSTRTAHGPLQLAVASIQGDPRLGYCRSHMGPAAEAWYCATSTHRTPGGDNWSDSGSATWSDSGSDSDSDSDSDDEE